MGHFDLPKGDFELLLGDNGKEEWQSVMMIDRLAKEDIASCVESWSERHKVLGARYNGKDVNIPSNYHWELQHNGETLGRFAKRKEAKLEYEYRRALRFSDKTVVLGSIEFVEDDLLANE